ASDDSAASLLDATTVPVGVAVALGVRDGVGVQVGWQGEPPLVGVAVTDGVGVAAHMEAHGVGVAVTDGVGVQVGWQNETRCVGVLVTVGVGEHIEGHGVGVGGGGPITVTLF